VERSINWGIMQHTTNLADKNVTTWKMKA